MATQAMKRVGASELEAGDRVNVYVNGRAATHLGTHRFTATVEATNGTSIQFRPVENLQPEMETHTWYADIGYIHGHHVGLERYTDVGKVEKVERAG